MPSTQLVLTKLPIFLQIQLLPLTFCVIYNRLPNHCNPPCLSFHIWVQIAMGKKKICLRELLTAVFEITCTNAWCSSWLCAAKQTQGRSLENMQEGIKYFHWFQKIYYPAGGGVHLQQVGSVEWALKSGLAWNLFFFFSLLGDLRMLLKIPIPRGQLT